MKWQARQSAEQERAQFAERLAEAMVARGMPVSATQLKRAFNTQSPKLAVTVHAARKWITGESIPAQARLRALAAILAVSATWLRFGEEVAVSANKPLSAQEHMLIQHFRALPASQRTHVLALVQSMAELSGKK